MNFYVDTNAKANYFLSEYINSLQSEPVTQPVDDKKYNVNIILVDKGSITEKFHR